MKSTFFFLLFVLCQFINTTSNAQTTDPPHGDVADSLVQKIYLDRQKGEQNVDLEEIVAALEKTGKEEFVIAKIIGQQIMVIFDKAPYYQGLTFSDYESAAKILHEQVQYCKTKKYNSLALTTLEILQFSYDYAYEKDRVIETCKEGIDYYKSLPVKEKEELKGANFLMAAFSYGVLQQKMMYNDLDGIMEWIDMAVEMGNKYYNSAKYKKSSVVFYARPLSEAARYYSELGKVDSAILYWDIVVKESKKCENFEMLLAVQAQKAHFFMMHESYKEALELYFEDLNISKKIKNVEVQVSSLYGIAKCYELLENKDKAREFYNRLMTKVEEKDEVQIGLLPMIYIGIATFYEAQGMLDSAIYYKQKEQEIYVTLGRNNELFFSSIELAILHLEKKDTVQANLSFDAAIQIGLPPLNDRNLTLGLNALAAYSSRVRDYQSMIFYAKSAFNQAKRLNIIGEQMNAVEHLIKGYLYQEKKDSADKYFNEYKQQQLKFYAVAQDLALFDIQTKYETKEKEQKNESLDAQNKLERENRNLSIGMMFFAMILALGMVVLYFRQKKVSTQLLNLQQTKDKLFSIIAHDLRTPFNALIGFSEIVKGNPALKESNELKSSFDIIQESSRTAYFLFEDLLGWTKSQTGQLSFSAENLYLQEAVEISLSPLQGMLTMKKITLNTNLELQWVEGDKYMLHTIIRNVISNAAKFLNQNGTLGISSYGDGKFIRIEIKDDGQGMDPEVLEKLFDDGQNKKGLGLLLCKDFVKRHHGRIGAESSLGEGTLIWFTIPRGMGEEKQE
jgi:signal transduction histidine kinase/tetratricopeptide (TPR) repeat protein